VPKPCRLLEVAFGGAAAGDASIKSAPGETDRIVFLGAAPNLPAEKLRSRVLFIVARDDANDAGLRLPGIRAQFQKAPEPKELIVLDGSEHAQFLFQTDQGARVMHEILRFLNVVGLGQPAPGLVVERRPPTGIPMVDDHAENPESG
jgi:hypothetical protein